LVGLGTFRKDFYFRLKSGHTIDLAPLRSSPQKVQDACTFYCLKNGISLSKRLTDFYETLAWPGNLRQLFGHLDKKRILSRSIKLDFDQLDEELLAQSSDLMELADPNELVPLQEMKEDYVKKVLAKCEGNVAHASRKLRVTEKTIKSILVKSSWQEHK
jgi:transcriptional regulator of acetoin/glycerol metabolism